MAIVHKWIAVYDLYENGEVVCQREVTYPDSADGKDIHFDTKAEAEAYLDQHINGEFALGHAIKMPVEEGSGIPYKEVLRLEAEAKCRARVYLYSCPFCGKTPQRKGNKAHCQTCDITLPASRWNNRSRY